MKNCQFLIHSIRKSNLLYYLSKKNLNLNFQVKSKIWKYRVNNYKSIISKILYSLKFNKDKYIFLEYKETSKKNKKLESVWEIILGTFCILLGFFSATSAITIIGSVADWDPLAAAVMLCWSEYFTKIFYYSNSRPLYLKLINSFRVGINFGMFVDALKLTS